MKITKQRERVKVVEYDLDFSWKDDTGAGFSFPCDKSGKVVPLNPEAQANYDKCVSGEYDVVFNGIKKYEHSYWEPAEGKCACGAKVVLSDFTNTCGKCGRDYNFAGSLLAPRHQWGEETGEHWSECY